MTLFQSTALHFAAGNGDTEIIDLLLKQKGINVNIKDSILI